MIRLKKVLVPTDFSADSKLAVEYACELADKFGAELHLLHVLPDLTPVFPEPGLVFSSSSDYVEELRASGKRGLDQALDPEWAQKHTVVKLVRDGPPFLEILKYAKDNAIDLIVMGTHGRSGIAQLLIGSVAEKVVRKAGCPVLTVRHGERRFVMP